MKYGKELLQFLAELSENNNKEWFEINRNRYQDLRNSFTATMENLHPLLMKFDKDLETVNPKGTMFRINRDIRFSKDKSPYKNNFGSYFALGGSQSELAGYYIHIQPQNCFVGGGIYMPQPNVLKKIRQEIDYNSEEFLEIINETNFQKYFGTVQGEKLKNTPKDYEKTHPMSEYLKLKGFFVVANFTNEQICNNDFVEQMAVRFETMYPLNVFLNKAVK
jgi:uncharacterized protein (TIGR02453 family)